ncbi:COPI associated protein-domain-containing protein [Syncephalis fuscata]|nr:COPI associated protein-domain-containing protein [Syncephalis fuscata]
MARPRLDRFGLAILLCTLNILVYIVVIIAAILNLLSADFATIIINVYIIILSLCLIVNEFQTPVLVQEYFKFTCTFLGRGLVFFFLGCVVIRRERFNVVAGIVAAAVGVFYLILSFTPGTPSLLGLFVVFRERRDYWNEREAKKLSQQAARSQIIVTNHLNNQSNQTLATKTISPYASGHPSQVSFNTSEQQQQRPSEPDQHMPEARRSRVSIQLSQISLPEGATKQVELPPPPPTNYPYPYATSNGSRPSFNNSQTSVPQPPAAIHSE